MAYPKAIGTRDIPLKLASSLTELVTKEWREGKETFLANVSPTTRELLTYWDPEGPFSDRQDNFNVAQWQAILNVVYVHEILKVDKVSDIYEKINPSLLEQMGPEVLQESKYDHPKYCLKMATSTGKTWVMEALLVWQILNSGRESAHSDRYANNFLFVAPGIIVYERLLNAFKGREISSNNGQRKRDFQSSDFALHKDLLIPPPYEEEIFGFVQNNTVEREEIGKKVTSSGFIGVMNWQQIMTEEEPSEVEENDKPWTIVKDLLPLTPSTGVGHSLEELDRNYSKGSSIKFLAKLSRLVVMNDEAHHLGEYVSSEEEYEKEWQKSLDFISDGKETFLQFDFTATPYNVTGSGMRKTKHYFPHIIIDFGVRDAIAHGLVKIVAIDKRKEITSIPLDFSSEKIGSGEYAISEGQKIMLRAALSKLTILEEQFTRFDSSKHPKMLVLAENTQIVPQIVDFLKQEGLADEDIVQIHTGMKRAGAYVTEEEWKSIKEKVFNIDNYAKPKVIVSVLMLREGFDVNNICVIVPLRASSSNILVEQIVGRGLRLMWRGNPEYEKMRNENREKLLKKKEEPDNFIDILSIIEHPAFMNFYTDELGDSIGETKTMPSRATGDFISVGLKDDYEKYDLFWPVIIKDKEETIRELNIDVNKLEPYRTPLKELKKLVQSNAERFYSKEVTEGVRFGEYEVKGDIFTAKNYNSFITKMVNGILASYRKKRGGRDDYFPMIQVEEASIARSLDDYIRHRLFEEEFDPMKDNNWQVLIMSERELLVHILKNIGESVYKAINDIKIEEAVVQERHFSEVKNVRMREGYSVQVAKCIYPRLAYPSNRGGLEKDFIEFLDNDSKVSSFIKIDRYYYPFANVLYLREDGILARYYPDFIVRIGNEVYIVETKADQDMNSYNVKSKRRATVNFIDRLNDLHPTLRHNYVWDYKILSQTRFYDMKEKGATTKEILDSIPTRSYISGEGTFDDFKM
ncbi:MAG: DEAD/DEAH box helicase family protein [Thermoplasmata archaeon]